MTAVLNLETLSLDKGSHSNPESGFCLLEVVSMFANEPFGDHPQCVCPVLAAFGRSWNDSLPNNQRQRLKQYIPRLLNTRSTKAVEERRALMAADWLIREFTPAWLELTPALKLHAEALRAHPEITGTAGFLSIAPILVAARKEAGAAGAAAWAAAWDAAWDAAGAAAGAAARAAAWDAAWDVITPTRDHLIESAHALYSRMIEVSA